jgi:hypothetical protein
LDNGGTNNNNTAKSPTWLLKFILVSVVLWGCSLFMLFAHLEFGAGGTIAMLDRQQQSHQRALSRLGAPQLDTFLGDGYHSSSVSTLLDTYQPKVYPPPAFPAPWNKTNGFLPLQGGQSGRTLIMSPWKTIEDKQDLRVSLAPFGTRESGVLTCEDGTQIIVGGYNIDYARMRGVLQILPRAGRRPNPETVNP